MAILVNRESKIIIQGITGSVGRMFADRMLAHGTPLVGGTSPGKGGQDYRGVPVFNLVREAVAATGADTSVLVVPARFIRGAVLEAIEAGIKTLVLYAEGVPVQDTLYILEYARLSGVRLFGPNSAGVFSPGEANISDLQDTICNVQKGGIGIVSKSGTLSYEAVDIVVSSGFGISTVVCLGGDPVVGMEYKDVLRLFMEDEETQAVVMLGEIGGYLEIDAAPVIREGGKPVVCYIAGQQVPPGKKMGHAGAIITAGDDSAEAKNRVLRENGAHTVNLVGEIGRKLRELVC